MMFVGASLQVQANKIYKWVDEKGQTHFTTTPPTTTNTVPLKTSPKDLELRRYLRGVWWSLDNGETIRAEFKKDFVTFSYLSETRDGIQKKPYFLATYDVQAGKLFTGYSYHLISSLRSNSTHWTLFEPKKHLLLLTRDSGQSHKSNWALRKLKPLKKHPSGAPVGDFFCAQRPKWVLKSKRGIFVWIDKEAKQAIQGSYLGWQPPTLLLDRVFDLQEPVNPRSEELYEVEVMTFERHRLIMKLPTDEVLACKPV